MHKWIKWVGIDNEGGWGYISSNNDEGDKGFYASPSAARHSH